VSIYYTGKVPGYLEAVEAALDPPKKMPNLPDLFPKKAKK
jgi:hypothetical protein